MWASIYMIVVGITLTLFKNTDRFNIIPLDIVTEPVFVKRALMQERPCECFVSIQMQRSYAVSKPGALQ